MSMSKYAEILKDHAMKEGYNLNFKDIGEYTILELQDEISPGVMSDIIVYFPKGKGLINILNGNFINEINPLRKDVALELVNNFNMKYACVKCILRNNAVVLQESIALDYIDFNPSKFLTCLLDFSYIMKEEYPYFRNISLY